jgi:hypothetical protein|tara:strand:- start:1028 stop:1282 length:255 start_codon:yes stop_codon:yes gene_type:complete
MQKFSKNQRENERISSLKKVVLSGISEQSLLNQRTALTLKIAEYDQIISKMRFDFDVRKYKVRIKYTDLQKQQINLNTLLFGTE